MPVVEGKADFYYLNPGKYGARLINDTNGNGVWDTGDYAAKRQPEMVYYYPQVLEFKARLYESLVGGMLTKEEYASYKAKYTKQAEDIKESIRVLKEKLTDVLENRSERNRWISQFTQFATLETLDRRALIHMVQSVRVRGKKELDITFTHEDEYKKALQLLALAAQQKDYEQRKVG